MTHVGQELRLHPRPFQSRLLAVAQRLGGQRLGIAPALLLMVGRDVDGL
jgi:hypothetical protein